MNGKWLHLLLLIAYLAVLIWSVIKPQSYLVWFLEVIPAIAIVIVVMIAYPRFKLTNLTYVLLWISICLAAIGAHYTYEKMPLFDWVRGMFHFQRNHYDRFTHFMQGITSAILFREILIRKSPVKKGKWLTFIVIGLCLALSGTYELSEFAVAMISKGKPEEFLGTQGDFWDSQMDMLFLLTGAILSLSLFGKMHNRLLSKKRNQ